MAIRPGEKPLVNNTDYVILPNIPGTQKMNAGRANYIGSKVLEPFLESSFPESGGTVSISAVDEIAFPEYTQTGVLNFVKDGSVLANQGAGNGIEGVILSNGSAINFSSDFNVAKESIQAGIKYHIRLVWNGLKFVGSLRRLGGTGAGTPSYADVEITANNTSGDGQDSGAIFSATPVAFRGFQVGGRDQIVGNGVKTKDCYVSSDGGTTAKALSAIVAGDTVYWNGVIAGFDLVDTMNLTIKYDI